MAKTNYERVKEWRKRNPDKVNAQAERYRAKHPDKIAAIQYTWRQRNLEDARAADAERKRDKRKNDPEGQRARMAKFKAKKELKRTEIAGRPRPSVCDICHGNHHLGIVFDHCHQSGKFRGWLCDRCNKVLGIMKDDPKLLRKLARYLDRHGQEVDTRRDQASWSFAQSVACSGGRENTGEEIGESSSFVKSDNAEAS